MLYLKTFTLKAMLSVPQVIPHSMLPSNVNNSASYRAFLQTIGIFSVESANMFSVFYVFKSLLQIIGLTLKVHIICEDLSYVSKTYLTKHAAKNLSLAPVICLCFFYLGTLQNDAIVTPRCMHHIFCREGEVKHSNI